MIRTRSYGIRLLVAVIAVCTVAGSALAAGAPAKPLGEMIEDQWNAGKSFGAIELLAQKGSSLSAAKSDAQRMLLGSALNEGFVLSFDRKAARALLSEGPDTMTMALPSARGGKVQLELARVSPFTPDFRVVTSSSADQAVSYTSGVHYRGVVRGVAGSVAAVSVFEGEVMGLYSTPEDGNFVLGRLGGPNTDDTHVLYAARDLKAKSTFSCQTQDDQASIPSLDDGITEAMAMATCVRIYVEADYDLYQNKGSVQNVVNYVTGFFNQSATLYQNDGIPISMSELYVWNRRSPYKGSSSSTLLSQFQRKRTSFNGDLGHLVALKGGGGIAAGFSGFCNPTTSQRQCFSMVQTSYNNVPTYSWTVMVFTHEMGHLMGSRHTHACVWNGNNTAIDGCYSVEGTCPRPGFPSNGGTIMSYCHLQSVGINFTNGFGPQPGALIRSNYSNASCLVSCP